jgi:hypothetical protein
MMGTSSAHRLGRRGAPPEWGIVVGVEVNSMVIGEDKDSAVGEEVDERTKGYRLFLASGSVVVSNPTRLTNR